MANFTVTVKGAEAIIRKFANTAIVRDELEQAAHRGVFILRRATGIAYTRSRPPRPANSRYVRTFNLMRGWRDEVKPFATGVKAVMDNPVEYGPDVLDADDQAAIHSGRWPTTRAILKAKRKAIVNQFARARDAIIRRLS